MFPSGLKCSVLVTYLGADKADLRIPLKSWQRLISGCTIHHTDTLEGADYDSRSALAATKAGGRDGQANWVATAMMSYSRVEKRCLSSFERAVCGQGFCSRV